ncbi:MAG: cysteine desulfurase [Mollicutes bacterium]|nr:cysteine desulfurase [Mollicutes bacterium]
MNRDDFPAIDNNLIYFDNSATSLKPKCVIDKMMEYYSKYTSNIHRGDYNNAIRTNKEYDEAREVVKNFIHAKSMEEIVFTSGTTDSLNTIVFGYFKNILNKDDEVLITKSEHASNVLPWFVLEKMGKCTIKYIRLNENYEVTLENVKKSINKNTKVISIAHVSNVIGDIRDIEGIGKIAKDNNLYFVVDAAQSVSHINIDVIKSNISFLAFSGHKMCGPTGVGVLYGKNEYLKNLVPLKYGGGMNESFDSDKSYILKNYPTNLEAGTPPIAEVIGLKEAINYVTSIGVENIHKHELELKKYLISRIENMDNIIIYNKDTESGIVTFNIKDVFAQDTSIYLNTYGIAIRAGNHCAKILKDEIGIKNTCRISFYIYNTFEEIDKLVEALKNSDKLYDVVI